jgi:hypothetical protein
MKDHHTSRVRPNSLLIRREGSDSEKEQWTEEGENRALVAASFESTDDEDDLWKKDGVWFGRNAALQRGQREAKDDGPVHQ